MFKKAKSSFDLRRRVNADGEECGSYRLFHTPRGSYRQEKPSMRTDDLETAERRAAKFLAQQSVMTKRGGSITYAEVYAQYLDSIAGQAVNTTSMQEQWAQIQHAVGPRRLTTTSEEWWKRYFADMQACRNGARKSPSGKKIRPLSDGSMRLYRDFIGRLHNFVVKRNLIPGAELPKINGRSGDNSARKEFYTAEEVEKIMRKLERMTASQGNGRPHWLHLFTLIGLTGGVRRSRNLAATWDLVDWENRTIDYARTFSAPDNRDEPDAASKRCKRAPLVEIGAVLFPVLRAAYDHDLALCRGSAARVGRMHIVGAPRAQIYFRFGQMVKAALGYAKGSPHTLKHTLATHLLGQHGFDIYSVSKMLNTSIKTLETHYGKRITGRSREMVDAAFPASPKVTSLAAHRRR